MNNKLLVKKFFEYINIMIFIVYSGTLFGLGDLGLQKIVNRKNFILCAMFLISIMYLLIYFCKIGLNIIVDNIWIVLFLSIITLTSLVFHKGTKNVPTSCFMLFGTIAYSMMLCTTYNYKKLLIMLFKSQCIVTSANILFTLVYPQFGKMLYEGKYVWRGLLGHKNSLSAYMAFGIMLSYAIYKMDKKYKMISIINIILSVTVLMLTKSVTSSLIVIASFMVYKFYCKINMKKNPSMLMLLLNGFVYTIVFFGQKYNDLFIRLFNRDLTLTGRVAIWEVIIDLVNVHPIIGYGYGGVWYQEAALEQYIWSKTFIGMSTAHNGFLEWALQIGIIGMLVYVYILVVMGKRIVEIRKDNEILFLISIQYITFMLMFYISESIFEANKYQMLVFIILSIYTNNIYFSNNKIKLSNKCNC